jgi:hypothetical protein
MPEDTKGTEVLPLLYLHGCPAGTDHRMRPLARGTVRYCWSPSNETEKMPCFPQLPS